MRLGRRDGDGDGDGDDAPLDVDDAAKIATKSLTPPTRRPVCDDGDIEWVGRVDDDDDEEDSSEYDSNFIDSDDDDDDEYDDEYDSDFIDSDEDEDEDEDEAAAPPPRSAWRRRRHLLQQVAANARALVREEMNRRYATIDRDRDDDDDQDRDGSHSARARARLLRMGNRRRADARDTDPTTFNRCIE